MTLPTAFGAQASQPVGLRDVASTVTPMSPMPMRTLEIAALRGDGSIFIGQQKVPATPVFESAASAFARGTLVATPEGEIAIEDLQPGDSVTTSTQEAVQVMWIGSSTFVPADTGQRTVLTRVVADSFGAGRPDGFLTLGPAARLLHTPLHLRSDVGEKRLLTPVHDFVDGVNVIEVMPPTPVRLFHICLERHAALLVNGVEIESFHPATQGIQLLPNAMKERFMAMFPAFETLSDFGSIAFARAPEEMPTGT